MKIKVDYVGNIFINTFHYLGLFIIGGVVVWSSMVELFHVFQKGSPDIDDVLTLFIYLELGAMVGIYFNTKHMPIVFLLYVGLTALIRHLIGVVSDHGADYKVVIAYCLAILVLSVSVLIVRFGSFKFPSNKKVEKVEDAKVDLQS